MIDKEEIIETEEKIEKALKKEQEQRQVAKEQKLKEDFAETESKFLLQDKAQELEDSSKKVSTKRLKINKIPSKLTQIFHFRSTTARLMRKSKK